MGKGDTSLSVWLEDKERFADLFNGAVFQGEQIVEAEKLETDKKEAKELISSKDGKLKNIERNRDIVMKWKDGVNLAILACENQERIHYAMPVRTMLYDGLSYAEQIRQLRKKNKMLDSDEFLSGMRKEDKLIPIFTLVFYYGDKAWDGSKDIYGLLEEPANPKVKEAFKQFVPNYHINVLDINQLQDISQYKTDLQVVFGMLKCRKEKEKIKKYVQENSDYFQHVDIDTYNVLRVLLKAEKQLEKIKEKGKEAINMCEALQGIFDDGVEQGIQQGREQGIEQGKELGLSLAKQILRLWRDGKSEEEIAEQCDISLQEVKEILE